MQLRTLQENYVEKVLRDQSGRLARVTFYVYEQDGRIKARVVDVVYLEGVKTVAKIFALSGDTLRNFVGAEKISEEKITSPYFDLDTIFTTGSKPRAPSNK